MVFCTKGGLYKWKYAENKFAFFLVTIAMLCMYYVLQDLSIYDVVQHSVCLSSS